MSETTADLNRRANALRAEGRLDEAIGVLEQVVRTTPASGVAEHNLAAALGDAGRWKAAEGHLAAAGRKGLDAPETWLVKARCMLALGRLDEAERAFREATRRRAGFMDAQRELAQLIWMRSGDPKAMLADLDVAIRNAPQDLRLASVKAQALEYAGRLDESLALLERLTAQAPGDPVLAVAAAQAAMKLARPGDALAHARRADQLAPGEAVPQITLAEALVGVGEAAQAAEIAGAVRKRFPNDQHAIAMQATAWRMLGDPRYRTLYDYPAFVSRNWLDTPPGWASREAYVSDLASALKAVHAFKEHPFNQSLRHGSQAADLLEQDHPAIRALPRALDAPIRARLEQLGRGDDPVRSRNTGRYAFKGMWSVRLHPNGYHVDHVHPQGWLSSACYIETVRDVGHEGWIKFGEPGVRTQPKLEAEHFEKPEPGLLVLFPSYMWHGTVPFSGDQTRLTFAFDLVPA